MFSPGGGDVLTASYDGTAKLWTASNHLLTFTGHTDWVFSAVYSKDGASVVTASLDGTAKLNASTGECTMTLRGHTTAVISAVFSLDIMLTAANDGTAKIWNCFTGDCIQTLGAPYFYESAMLA